MPEVSDIERRNTPMKNPWETLVMRLIAAVTPSHTDELPPT